MIDLVFFLTLLRHAGPFTVKSKQKLLIPYVERLVPTATVEGHMTHNEL